MPAVAAASVSVYFVLPETKEKPSNWASTTVAMAVSNATVPSIVMALANVAAPVSVALALTTTVFSMAAVKETVPPTTSTLPASTTAA